MEMQRGPRGLRDREYPEDVAGHIDGAPDEPAEQQAEPPAETAPDDVEGHVAYRALGDDDGDDVQGHRMIAQAFGDQIDGRER